MSAPRSDECQKCTTLCFRLGVLINATDGDRINTKTWELQPNTWATSLSRAWSGISRADTIAAMQVLHDDCLRYTGDSLRSAWNKRLVMFHIRESIPGMRVIRDTYMHTATYDALDAIIRQFGELVDAQTTM